MYIMQIQNSFKCDSSNDEKDNSNFRLNKTIIDLKLIELWDFNNSSERRKRSPKVSKLKKKIFKILVRLAF